MKIKTGFLSVCLGSAFLFGVTGCDIDQTEQGSLPDVDVEGGNMPEYDVETPEVDVSMEERTVTVPDVDVDMEEKQIEVPDVDISIPEE